MYSEKISSTNILLVFLVSVLFLRSALGGAVAFKNCEDVAVTGTVYNVIVPSCAAIPCTFYKGQNHSIEIDFELNTNTDSLRTEVYGILEGISVAWPGLDPDGCKYMLVGLCPLRKLDYVTFGMSVQVSSVYPSVDAILKWIINGDDGKPIFCFTIPVQLK